MHNNMRNNYTIRACEAAYQTYHYNTAQYNTMQTHNAPHHFQSTRPTTTCYATDAHHEPSISIARITNPFHFLSEQWRISHAHVRFLPSQRPRRILHVGPFGCPRVPDVTAAEIGPHVPPQSRSCFFSLFIFPLLIVESIEMSLS